MIGNTLGPYEVVVKLGEGGMGEVYRARDSKLNREVAIKVLLPAVANDPDRLARFSREAQVLASLNHPNIAHIHGLEESGGVTARCPLRHKYGNMVGMKTTLEIPDLVFRRAKAKAAERGQALRAFVTEALQEKLAGRTTELAGQAAPFMKGFGKLRPLRRETARIQRVIEREFDVVETEDRR